MPRNASHLAERYKDLHRHPELSRPSLRTSGALAPGTASESQAAIVVRALRRA